MKSGEVRQMEKKKFLRDAELAKELGVSASKLRQDRHLKRGLPYIKAGCCVLYDFAEVLKYLEKQTVRPEA
jgi:hypothetical protein